jgi:alkanesulfonate monooxygenase SsuD/methylene tetrahydromethanopterin reductase-like flavin-dependent oxidoreductase (luciferase family)
MTSWQNEGFSGELFKLMGAFLPPPPPGIEPPPLWGVEEHVREMFATTGARPSIAREIVEFEFASVEEAVRIWTEEFGPFVIARTVLEPQGRWDEFQDAFADLVQRFNRATDGSACVESAYFVITIDR